MYEDAGWMRSAYWERGLTLRQMAVEAECGMRTVARWMEIHGIPTDRGRLSRKPTGDQHPSWKGGPAPCPKCGSAKSFGALACAACRDRSGARNPKWRGDDRVTYDLMHERVSIERGKASTHLCASCGGQAAHWSYDHTDPKERRANRGERDQGPFSLDAARYRALCVKCHKQFDMDHLRAQRADGAA